LLSGLLAARGHRVDVLEPSDPPLGGDRTAAIAELRQAIDRFRSGLEASWAVQRPDLLHCELVCTYAVVALDLAQRLGIPATSSWHNTWRYAPVGQGERVRALALAQHRRTRHVFAECPEDLAGLRSAGISQSSLAARGIDSGRFHPRCRDTTLRMAWGAQSDDPVLLWLGRVVPEKSPEVFAACAGAVRAVRPRVQAVVVGDGPASAGLRQALPWAHYVGQREADDLARHVASADLLVMPSLTEGFGNVVLEAMASGVAVSAYARAAAGLYVVKGVTGTLAQPGDLAAFVRGTVELAMSPEQLRQAGAAGRRAVEPLTWEAAAAQVEAALTAALHSA
jgi:glycosyltransferase involved in cell wall biosynthesis